MSLKWGMKGSDVEKLTKQLNDIGFILPIKKEFDADVNNCIIAFQQDQKLDVDGVVGPLTQKELDRCCLSTSFIDKPTPGVSPDERSARMSDIAFHMFTVDGNGCRYGGMNVDIWNKMENGNTDGIYVPLGYGIQPSVESTLVKPYHCLTCGHFAWLVISCWLNCFDKSRSIFPTFRTGRQADWIYSYPSSGITVDKSFYRGYKEYMSKVHSWKTQNMSKEYSDFTSLSHVNMLEFSHHVGLMIKVDDSFGIIDPRTGKNARKGLYRFAADGWYPKINGKSYYSGWRITWRRIGSNEPSIQYKLYSVCELKNDGTVDEKFGGVLSGIKAQELKFE